MSKSSAALNQRANHPRRGVPRRKKANVVLSIDPEVFGALRLSPEEFAAEIRLAAAIHWYSQGALSQGKAAEIAGCSRAEFISALGKRGIDVCQVTANDLSKEIALAASHRR